MGGHKLAKEVRTFFSHSNQVALACKFSRKIKETREKLDDIVKDGTQFEFVRGSPERGIEMRERRDQTMSYVDEDKVVGRDGDKKAILDMLLASAGHEHMHEALPVIPIVGMGGMGKTTLAQLIYNDPLVQEYFEMRLWVCVSDVFNIKAIIDKLLKSATTRETPNLEVDQLQGLWRKEVTNKKYLLVLDDVWNEKREDWLKLRELLMIGRRGSKIIVTTRSMGVAEIMGTSPPYELQKLSEEKSLVLFEKMAFKPGEAQQKPQLVEIGREIVKKCGYVPLAIRTLGCLLYGKEKSKWLSVKDTSLAKIRDNQSDIMNVLRLSYHHLWSPLKNCFAYCALFPKDHEFKKEMLIELWIAEGFIIPPSNDGQSLDEAAEEYFHTLMQRGFFQDIERTEWGVIWSFKMHDLMHDLAQEVAGIKCKGAKFDERIFDEKILHLSLTYQLNSSWEIPNSMLNLKLLRTFLLVEQLYDGSPYSKSIHQQLVTRFRCLRVLDLHLLGLKSLPSSVGNLIHLRYLDLSLTLIERLPDSITNLWNLQTLNLQFCKKLKALPRNMGKLSNLRILDVDECEDLSHMPSRLGGLTLLKKLPRFIVNHKHDAANLKSKSTAKLSDLKNLNNLRGHLDIEIRGNLEDAMLEAREANLSSKHGLTLLVVSFPEGFSDCGAVDCSHDEVVLEGLEPPSGVTLLAIQNYRGQKLPRWGMSDNICTTLPNLVEIRFENCKRCQQFPAFSQLPFLKNLILSDMESVEYIESDVFCGVPSSTSSKLAEIETRVFPSLEQLELYNMKNLKGWWKEVEVEESVEENDNTSESTSSYGLAGQRFPTRFMQLSKLSRLFIEGCPNLRMLPLCPNVEDLLLVDTNKSLSVFKVAITSSSSSSSSPSLSTGRSGSKLQRLRIDNTEDLMSLPSHCLYQLSIIQVVGDDKLESTDKLGGVFSTLSSSLQSLFFTNCNNLRSIAKGLEHLTALEYLTFEGCQELDVAGDKEGMPWKALNTSLHTLTLDYLPKLVRLPGGLQHLKNLRNLYIVNNDDLEELPEWISCFSSLEYLELSDCPKVKSLPESFSRLTSLNQLRIIQCPELAARCQGPNGSD